MRKLLLLFMLAAAAFAQESQDTPLPSDVDAAVAGTVKFEETVTAGVTDLVTNVAPSIMPFGWTLLGLFGAYALISSQLQTTMRAASMHHYAPLAGVVAYVAVLYRIVIASTMMSFYLTPIPGLSINFHQIFPDLARALSSAITTDLLKQVLGHFADAVHYLPPVGFMDVLPALITVLVLGLITVGQVAMTIITSGSYAIVGLLTLCGPLMIPFFVLPGHDKKFWTWFDNMLSYSMYVFIGSGFIYIFCHSYMDFFTNLHGFGVGQWLVSLPYLGLITVVFLWTMFKVPEITHIIFGGVSGAAEGINGLIQNIAVRAVMAAIL